MADNSDRSSFSPCAQSLCSHSTSELWQKKNRDIFLSPRLLWSLICGNRAIQMHVGDGIAEHDLSALGEVRRFKTSNHLDRVDVCLFYNSCSCACSAPFVCCRSPRHTSPHIRSITSKLQAQSQHVRSTAATHSEHSQNPFKVYC